MKAQFSVTKGLLCRARGLRSWVWEELRLPLWLEVGGCPGRGACGPGGCHPRCLDSLPAFSEGETELSWAFQMRGAEVVIAESVDGAAGLGEATERSRTTW